jgi:hypothetical protein
MTAYIYVCCFLLLGHWDPEFKSYSGYRYICFVCVFVVLFRQRTCGRPIPAKWILPNTVNKIKTPRKGRLLTLLGFHAIQEDGRASGRSLVMKLGLMSLVRFLHSYVIMHSALKPGCDGAQSLQYLLFFIYILSTILIKTIILLFYLCMSL